MGRGVSQGYTGTAPGAMGGQPRALKAKIGREYGTLVPACVGTRGGKIKAASSRSVRLRAPTSARLGTPGQQADPPASRPPGSAGTALDWLPERCRPNDAIPGRPPSASAPSPS